MELSGIFDNTPGGARLLYCTGTWSRPGAKSPCGFSVYVEAAGFVIALTVRLPASVHYCILFKR
jgi:hypothetical protein